MGGWDRGISAAVAAGTLPSFHDPAAMLFRMISVQDLGVIAVDLLLRPADEEKLAIVHAEGPLGEVLGRIINVEPVPR